MKSKRRSEQDYEDVRQRAPYRLGLHGVEGRLVGSVQVMSAVHLALEARLLPDRVVWAEPWGDHRRHWGVRLREDKRLENRPGGEQVGRADRVEEENKVQEPLAEKTSLL